MVIVLLFIASWGLQRVLQNNCDWLWLVYTLTVNEFAGVCSIKSLIELACKSERAIPLQLKIYSQQECVGDPHMFTTAFLRDQLAIFIGQQNGALLGYAISQLSQHVSPLGR